MVRCLLDDVFLLICELVSQSNWIMLGVRETAGVGPACCLVCWHSKVPCVSVGMCHFPILNYGEHETCFNVVMLFLFSCQVSIVAV